MTNKEFKNKYGIKNYLDIKENMSQRLFILKNNKIINGYDINNNKGIVYLYYNKQRTSIEISNLFFVKDKDIQLLFNKEINSKGEIQLC